MNVAALIAILLLHEPSGRSGDPPPSRTAPTVLATSVRTEVERRLDALEREISAHEASIPREALMRRRDAVETFLAAGLVPHAIAFGTTPDLLPLGRYDFKDVPRPLRGAGIWSAARIMLGLPRDPAAAIAGRFEVRRRPPCDGDDAVTISGQLLATPQRVLLLAEWCEPCLWPHAVDFPIVPERFLIEWDDQRRRVAVALPGIAAHEEVVDHNPPRLDQPGDLYDLFDGLRPLPWLMPSNADSEIGDCRSSDSQRETRAADALASAPHPAADPDRREQHPEGVAIAYAAHDEAGAMLQRVTASLDTHASEPCWRIVIDQPPVACRWSSPHRYELTGDASGVGLPDRVLRPTGSVWSLSAARQATFSIHRDRIEGVLRQGTEEIASWHWSDVRALSHSTAFATERRWREALADGAPAAPDAPPRNSRLAHPPRTDSLPTARAAVIHALEHGDLDAVSAAVSELRVRLERHGFDAAVLVRNLEAVAESMAAVIGPMESMAPPDAGTELPGSAVEWLAAWIDRVWTPEIDSLAADELAGLLRERIAMGRFGAALLLATRLEDHPGADLAHRTAARRLKAALAESDEQTDLSDLAEQSPGWHVPSGRTRLETLLADRYGEASAHQVEARARATESPSTASLLSHTVSENLSTTLAPAGAVGSASPAPLWPALAALVASLPDDGTPQQEMLTRAIADVMTATDARPALSELDPDRFTRGFARWIESTAPILPRRTRTFAESEGFVRAVARCRDAIAAAISLGTPSDVAIAAINAEEQALLACTAAAAARIAHASGLDEAAGDRLMRRSTRFADERRADRGSPFVPELLHPNARGAAATGAAFAEAIAHDGLLHAMGERAAVEMRLTVAHPETASMRRLLLHGQLDAIARRIDQLARRVIHADPERARATPDDWPAAISTEDSESASVPVRTNRSNLSPGPVRSSDAAGSSSSGATTAAPTPTLTYRGHAESGFALRVRRLLQLLPTQRHE